MSSGDDDGHDTSQKIKEIYRYDEMSNKVLHADKRFQNTESDPFNDAELSHPQTMSGKISMKDMGSNVKREIPEEELKFLEKELQETTEDNIRIKESNVAKNTILNMGSDLNLKYHPTDGKNSENYNEILQWVLLKLGNDMPHDIILDTADYIIVKFKEYESQDNHTLVNQKKNELENELDFEIPESDFTTLIKLIRNITDFDTQKDREDGNSKIISILSNGNDDENDENKNDEDKNTLEREILMDQMFSKKLDEQENKKNKIKRTLDKDLLPNDDNIIKISSNSTFDELPQIFLINENYIFRKLSKYSLDESTITKFIELLISTEYNAKKFESNIPKIFNDEKLIDFVFLNRDILLWGLKLSKASENEIPSLLDKMKEQSLDSFVEEYQLKHEINQKKRSFKTEDNEDNEEDENGEEQEKEKSQDHLVHHKKIKSVESSLSIPPLLDLDKLKFDQGNKLITVSKVALPEGSYKKVKDLYDEINIPAPISPTVDYDLVSISSLPTWAQVAFPSKETQTLNAIQSKVYPAAFETDSNLLLCAPTGGGKTNVAMLTVLRALSKFYDEKKEKFNLRNCKIVYIAPLKALVQEQVREFERRLQAFGVKVAELTGDSNLNKQEIAQTQILVSTPEKWDIITRKMDDSSFAHLVSLVIIDEVHLLHDSRGPVLENIVSRINVSKYLSRIPRLVALSATLPNYLDVAKFLKVPEESIFFFDSSYRPCPLAQQFCSIREQSSIKRLTAMNEVCYDKTLDSLKHDNQVIIFVHSRKDTARTAMWLKNKFLESDNVKSLVGKEEGNKQILLSESENVQDPNLKSIIEYGIGIHHAGLSRNDRSLSEDLFAAGIIRVLVSTATLAWGVNLPAHTVIIKGTNVYSPETSNWEQLSPQDMLQMLGRAGRPRYDTHGEGIIITSHSELQYYLAVLNQQLPIESQLMSTIVDSINAEVVSGNIECREDAVNWFHHTYLHVRMTESPELYKVTKVERDGVSNYDLKRFTSAVVHSALNKLFENQLILYNENTGRVESTELGKISSYFYIKHTTVSAFHDELSENSSTIDIFRIFSLSDEFKYVNIRPEERKELKELFSKVPIPISQDIEDPLAKINILLQAYISKINFEGFALNSDMLFINQNAGRLLRSMYELCLKKNWSKPSKILLDLCKSVNSRMWVTNTPLRQYPKCPMEVIKRVEAAFLPWSDYLKLNTSAEIGNAIGVDKYGKAVFDMIRRFPKIKLKCSIQPLTRSLITFDLEIFPQWIWDIKLHGYGEQFVIIVEDTDGLKILYKQSLIIRPEHIGKEQFLDFSISLNPSQQKTLPPTFFISVISEKWFHCAAKVSTVIENIHLPKKFPPPTILAPTGLVNIKNLENEEFESLFQYDTFNKIQSNVFAEVYNTNNNILIAASKGSGKTDIALLAILNHWRQNKGRAVYISPSQDHINKTFKIWSGKLSDIAGGKIINKLDQNRPINLQKLAQSHLLLSTPSQFDILSKRWRKRKNVRSLELVIFDDMHEISLGLEGPTYENVISRIMYIHSQIENEARIVGLSSSISNGRDFGNWIDVDKENVFNFSQEERISPVEIHLQSFDVGNINDIFTSSMLKKSFEICSNKATKTCPIIYLNNRKSCIDATQSFISFAYATKIDILKIDEEEAEAYSRMASDSRLGYCIRNGIAFLYKGMKKRDHSLVRQLFEHDALSFLFVTKDLLQDFPKSDLVVVLGTTFYDYESNRYLSLSINSINEIVGNAKAVATEVPGRVVIMTNNNRHWYYKKFLTDSLPIESFIYYNLHDAFISEISNGIFTSKQICIDWLTHTYFYRRIHANPSFYGVEDVSSFGLSAYLTEVVENTLNDLQTLGLIEMSESTDEENEEVIDTILPQNYCLIAAHYHVSFQTMHTFVTSLNKNCTMKDILKILSSAYELSNISVDQDDLGKLHKLQKRLPLVYPGNEVETPASYKVFILLQSHFSRIYIPFEYQIQLDDILLKTIDLVNCIVDILSGDGLLVATTAMDLSQMIIQGVWDIDNPLRQIPYFTEEVLTKCKETNVETVYDVMALEDDDRQSILTMHDRELIKVANFINNYPNIELTYKIDIPGTIKVNEDINVSITLRKDDEPESLDVTSEKYPFDKTEKWWLFIGNVSTKEMYVIQKVVLESEVQEYQLSFNLETEGKHELSIWAVCDSYLDADKEVSFVVDVE